ncbi:MAG TPA: efflux RND transporter periplasmic adaptor subunit [Bacteroidota bacterium]|nr:efflux RND transporter periplasmic adaptor subunit [Bacteroidota bacterium]
MKQLKIIGIAAVAFIAVIALLLHNRAQSSASVVNNISTKYAVTVVTAGTQDLSETVSLTGLIAANSDVAVVSETQGRVTAIYSNVGDVKQAGAALVQVDDELKKAAFAAAEVNYEKAKKDLERYESLYKDHTITDSQIEQSRLGAKSAETQYIVARRQYRDTKITTPITGVVTSRTVEVGTMVNPGTVIGNVVDISRLKVKLNVAEADAFKLKTGAAVKVTTDIYPGTTFEGRIASISAKGDEAHTYPVEVTLSNSSTHPLKSGMFARIEFGRSSNAKGIVIPRDAIIGSVKNAQVYVVENDLAKLRSVVVREQVGTNVELASGVNAGARVVVNGQNNLKDNVPVTVISK